MHPILAEIVTENPEQDGLQDTGEQRQAKRRKLRLGVPADLNQQATRAIIHDLSEAGLMLETNAPLSIGDRFELELPEAGTIGAEVMWTMEGRFGCRFEKLVSRASVSASLLRSPADQAAAQDLPEAQAEAAVELPAQTERRPASIFITELSLLILAIVVALFAFALTALPISNQQF